MKETSILGDFPIPPPLVVDIADEYSQKNYSHTMLDIFRIIQGKESDAWLLYNATVKTSETQGNCVLNCPGNHLALNKIAEKAAMEIWLSPVTYLHPDSTVSEDST